MHHFLVYILKTILTAFVMAMLGIIGPNSATLYGQVQAVEHRDDLAPAATWKLAEPSDIKFAFDQWLDQSEATVETRDRVRQFLNQDGGAATGEFVDWVIDGIIVARPDVRTLSEQLRQQRVGSRPPDFSVLLDNPEEADFLRNHVRLFYARWLTQNEFYDEALTHFSELDIDSCLDPASLLFYRGLVEHQLLKKDECLKTIDQLLQNSNQLPKRYRVLSKLMLADIRSMEPDSLDEISRLMNDIRRRTGLFRSGKMVLEEEERVIKKLDQLIEELESQKQAQQANNNIRPGTPMEDSIQAGGKGDGEVTSKKQPEGGDWGDLPPAERAAALAEMAKDMPPHYRAVIEEYFRQLARENDR